MQTVGAFEAKTHFSALLERVEEGAQVVITKYGRAVAKLVPMVQGEQQRLQQAIAELKTFGRHRSLGGLDWKALRDEGRK